MTFDISGNTFNYSNSGSGIKGIALNVTREGGSTGTFTGLIVGNTIGADGVSFSGGGLSSSLSLENAGADASTVLIQDQEATYALEPWSNWQYEHGVLIATSERAQERTGGPEPGGLDGEPRGLHRLQHSRRRTDGTRVAHGRTLPTSPPSRHDREVSRRPPAWRRSAWPPSA